MRELLRWAVSIQGGSRPNRWTRTQAPTPRCRASSKLNGHDPYAYIRNVLTRLPRLPRVATSRTSTSSTSGSRPR
ncbi:transposase domain-containing protein [Variovorax paradoxus]|uniref:transposase domain-containing protein n=1 Tax=Variovorax paradoxus TaxID=34073 RepID=UPI0038D056F2